MKSAEILRKPQLLSAKEYLTKCVNERIMQQKLPCYPGCHVNGDDSDDDIGAWWQMNGNTFFIYFGENERLKNGKILVIDYVANGFNLH